MLTPEQKAAFVYSQSVAALAAIEAMKAMNHRRRADGYADAYDEEAFFKVIEDYGLGCNQVVAFFQED